MGKYDDIIDRLEKADGPSRALDLGIWECLPAEIVQCAGFDCPAYTASLDAAIALTEKLLPGQEYEITTLYNVARVAVGMNMENGPFHGERALPEHVAIAYLIATFKALQAQDRE